MEFRGIIYRYESPSGKSYVGQTVDEVRRKAEFKNLSLSYGGNKIYNARKKYGPENFQYYIESEICANSEEDLSNLLDIAESFYIQKYDSYKNGYNSTEGGESLRGYNKTKEQVEKQKRSLKEYYKTHRNPYAKYVLQYSPEGEFIKEWNSATEAETTLGYSRSSVSNCCTGRTKSSCGFIWRYKESDEIPLKIDVSGINAKSKKHQSILQFNTDGSFVQEWKSIKDIKDHYDLSSNSSQISEVCRGKRKTALGYIWRYGETVKDYQLENLFNTK